MRGFVRLGRVTGIPVSVHWTLAVIGWFLGLSLANGALPGSAPGSSHTAYWIAAATGVVLFFGSILIHELAHAWTARRYGVETEGIELWLLGGMARLSNDAPTPKADGLIAAAGPAEAPFSGANITVLAVCVVLLMFCGMMTFDLMRNMWSWDGAYSANSSILETIGSTIGWMEK